MKQKIFTITLILITIGLLLTVVWGSKNKKTESASSQNSQETSSVTTPSSAGIPIFFYGNTCPHCADVEEWMLENKIEEKIELVKKEVYDNQENSLELSQAAQSCGMDTSSIGVPFLYTPEGKCLVGTPDIVNYLSDKAGLSGKEVEQ